MRKAALSLITAAAIMMTATPHAAAEIAWQSNLRTAHSQAQAEGKLLLLHFYSDNCTWCDRLEAGSFKAPEVGHAVSKDFIPVKIHANRNPKLTEMFKVTKFPTDVIVTTEGKTLSHSVSPQVPDRYVAMLTKAIPAPAHPRIVTNPAAAESAAAEQAVAAATIAAPAAEPPAAELALPESIGNKVPGQLAGTRTDGLTLDMPGQADASTGQPTATAAIASAPAVDTEPSETPELAMQGYCAVTVIRDDRWAEGSPKHGVIHLGKLYLFVSEEAMQTFLADPTPYTPVLNEIDVVRFFEERKIVPGKREWGVKDPIYNRMFFFADEAARNHFENSYERYTKAAIEVMDKAVKDANPGT